MTNTWLRFDIRSWQSEKDASSQDFGIALFFNARKKALHLVGYQRCTYLTVSFKANREFEVKFGYWDFFWVKDIVFNVQIDRAFARVHDKAEEYYFCFILYNHFHNQ